MAKNTQVAKRPTNAPAIVEEKPDWLIEMESKGPVKRTDNFDASDVTIPRIKLLQGLSKECETFDTAKAGRFWHTGMDLNLGEKVEFVVCARKKKLLLVAPMEDGQGVLARAEDCKTWDRLGSWEVKFKDHKGKVGWEINDVDVGKSGLDQWGTSIPGEDQSPPAATLFYDYLVLLPDNLDLGPAVISLARSQIKKAKRGLNDKIQLHLNSGRPMQAVVFSATPVNDMNSSNQEFKNWSFTGAGFTSKEVFERAQELESMLGDFRVRDEDDVLNDELKGENVDSKEY